MKLKQHLTLLFLCFSMTSAWSQLTQNVDFCATLSAIMELRANPNNASTINFLIDTKNDWEFGKESVDYNDFSVCATTDWKLLCEIVGANGSDIDEFNGNGGKLPLACIGKKVIWLGTNIVSNFYGVTKPVLSGVTTVLQPAPGQSNIGDFDANTFQIRWSLGQWQLPLMPDESLLDKQVKAGVYKMQVVYTLIPN